MSEMVHKVTLSSAKEVLLREFKIKHQRLAAQAAAGKAGDNPTVLGVIMAEEILKLLLVQIDGKPVETVKLEDLDSLFSYTDYNQLTQVIGSLMGGEVDAPKTEVVSYGPQ